MAADSEIGNTLKTAKILHATNIVAPIIYIGILYYSKEYADIWIFESDDPVLVMIEWILAAVSVACLLAGYFTPRFVLRRSSISAAVLQTMNILRGALFQAVGVFGLILGILSTDWLISLPFIAVSIVALAFTFPTEAKWRRMLEPSDSTI